MSDFIVPDWPAPDRVMAMTTTRAFGNLAGHVDDDPEMLATRRELLRTKLPADPLWLTQVHGARCVQAENSHVGVEADACVARSPGHVCAVLTADCLPILLCDDQGSVVAAVHAGWRGLAAGVIEASVRGMATPGDRLLAWLGPGIAPAAYEVGRDVLLEFAGTDLKAFAENGNGKWLCDLYAIARHRLASVGVTRCWGGSYCSFSDHRQFFSHRRDGMTGRMASLIWIV
jgi:polyphenol oxidase